jgi:hypothetical protein
MRFLRGIPGWVAAEGGMWGDANQEYTVGWVSGLAKEKGLNITALAVSYNERGYDDTFMKAMRKALNAAGLAHVKTIGGDQCGESTWKLVADMTKDKELRDAIDIIGAENAYLLRRLVPTTIIFAKAGSGQT